jgi:hypothetical protein
MQRTFFRSCWGKGGSYIAIAARDFPKAKNMSFYDNYCFLMGFVITLFCEVAFEGIN